MAEVKDGGGDTALGLSLVVRRFSFCFHATVRGWKSRKTRFLELCKRLERVIWSTYREGSESLPVRLRISTLYAAEMSLFVFSAQPFLSLDVQTRNTYSSPFLFVCIQSIILFVTPVYVSTREHFTLRREGLVGAWNDVSAYSTSFCTENYLPLCCETVVLTLKSEI